MKRFKLEILLNYTLKEGKSVWKENKIQEEHLKCYILLNYESVSYQNSRAKAF